MGKKVRVSAYQRSDGTYVHSYTREDPRAKNMTKKELPNENIQDTSFIGGNEEQEEEQNDQYEQEGD